MNNYKFRAKSLNDGEWVYGWYIREARALINGMPAMSLGQAVIVDFIVFSIDGQLHIHEVDSNTIGQFTGLCDKNKKEIYDGDIVGEEEVYHFINRDLAPQKGNWIIIGEKIKNFTGKGEEKYIAGYNCNIVKWQEDTSGFFPFADCYDNCGHCGGGKSSTRTEIFGNIYDNPTLLTTQE